MPYYIIIYHIIFVAVNTVAVESRTVGSLPSVSRSKTLILKFPVVDWNLSCRLLVFPRNKNTVAAEGLRGGGARREEPPQAGAGGGRLGVGHEAGPGRGDDAVGNPHRAQIYKFEPFELILLLKLDKQFPVEQFEATYLSQQYPPPLLRTPSSASTPSRPSSSTARRPPSRRRSSCRNSPPTQALRGNRLSNPTYLSNTCFLRKQTTQATIHFFDFGIQERYKKAQNATERSQKAERQASS